MKRSIALLTSLVTAASCMAALSSCGDDRLYMPDLSGIDAAKATEEFDFLELTISAEAQSSTVLKGKIMEQSVRPGAKISTGTKVLLTISSGEDNPKIYKDGVDTGMTEAVTTSVPVTTSDVSTTAENATTQPTTTTLEADMFIMPNFRGVSLMEAVEKYSDSISFQIKDYVDCDLDPGQISAQDVPSGTPCKIGTTLYVSLASGTSSSIKTPSTPASTEPTTAAYDDGSGYGYDDGSYGYDDGSYGYDYDYGYDDGSYGYDYGYDDGSYDYGYDYGYEW